MEELYYPCSDNKGADQLHSYCAAPLFLPMQIVGFPVLLLIYNLASHLIYFNSSSNQLFSDHHLR